MKDYLEKRREEFRKQGGFTLMEMLIVVAIIAVLIAIAIPVFTSQLEKSREATDMANIRSAYGTVTVKYLTDGAGTSATVPVQQKVEGWQTQPDPKLEIMNESATSELSITAKTSGDYTISIDTAGTVTVS